jgi:chemotaxis protein methyltransferase CheR
MNDQCTALSGSDLDYIRERVRARSAIVLDPSKTYLVESRLAPLLRRHGLGSMSDLVTRLRQAPFGPLEDLVVDAMTTNETTWFRDVHPWTALERVIIPELVQRREETRTLTFWSAACSSGQEPYSLAILLKDRFPQLLATWNVRIIASDLSAEMLGRAAAGRYTQLEVNRGLPSAMLVRHFTQDGAHWQLNDDIRQMVEFRALNLLQPWGFVPQVDVLLMRNVLIYFDLEVKRDLLRRVRSTLRPDGVLLLGSAETTLHLDETFERLSLGPTTAYRPR